MLRRLSPLFAALLVVVIAAACGDSEEAGTTTTTADARDEAWQYATTIDPATAAGATAYRQLRSIELSGPGAAALGFEGRVEVLIERVVSPVDAIRMSYTNESAHPPALAADVNPVVALIGIGDRVWIQDREGSWREPAQLSVGNPLFGPLATLYDTALSTIPLSGVDVALVRNEPLGSRSADVFIATEFTVVDANGIGYPIDRLTVWIDSTEVFMLEALLETRGGNPGDGTGFDYAVGYTVFDIGADFTIEPPATG